MQILKRSLYILSIFLFSCNSTNQETEEVTEITEPQIEKVIPQEIENTIDSLPIALDDSSVEITETIPDKIQDTQKSIENKQTEISSPIPSTITDENRPIDLKEIKTEQAEIVSTKTSPMAVEVKEKADETPKEQVKVVFSHTIWDAILRKNVSTTGKVNYSAIDRSQLQEYLSLLTANAPQSSWSKNKKLAYWINAYNAFTIELILKNNTPKSIMDINNGKPWDLKFAKIGSKTYSLNNIEHDIIREQFKEPRIHFACVCAAKSCPKLLNKAYTASNLNASLNYQTKYFINNTSKNTIADKNLKVSQLFNWYASDFGDINSYILKYSNKEFKADKNIEFMDYNWSLNN